MFCLLCSCEYRRGFTTCADCDVGPATELSKEASPATMVQDYPCNSAESKRKKQYADR